MTCELDDAIQGAFRLRERNGIFVQEEEGEGNCRQGNGKPIRREFTETIFKNLSGWRYKDGKRLLV